MKLPHLIKQRRFRAALLDVFSVVEQFVYAASIERKDAYHVSDIKL